MVKSKGPKMEPWGTPNDKIFVSDSQRSNSTKCGLSYK